MKKYSCKRKDLSEEKPILERVDSLHVLLSRGFSNPACNFQQYHQMAERVNNSESSNSTVSGGSSNCTSPSSNIVIKETDLVSSWIYTNRKRAAENEEESQTSTQVTPSKSDKELLSEISELDPESPKFYGSPIPIAKQVNSRTSCFCYLTVILMVFVCLFGILSSIGGIVYLENFASSKSIPRKPGNESFIDIYEFNQSVSSMEDGNETVSTTVVNLSTENIPWSHTVTTVDGATSTNLYSSIATHMDFAEPNDTSDISDYVTSREDRTEDITAEYSKIVTSILIDNISVTEESICLELEEQSLDCITSSINSSTTESLPLSDSTVETDSGESITLTEVTSSSTESNKPMSSFRDIPESRSKSVNLRASIAEAVKRFQALDSVNLPSSRIKDVGKNSFGISISSTKATEDEAEEKRSYLNRLRLLMFDKRNS